MPLIDAYIPNADFHEEHTRWIDATPAVVWQALTTLALRDLTITRPFMWLRHSQEAGGRASQPLMTSGPVAMLFVDAGRYALGGAISKPWKRDSGKRELSSLEDFREFTAPGWVKYLTDFRLTAHNGGTTLSTCTRVVATSKPARRRFRTYWFLIRGGSGQIRRDILRSVDRMATRTIRVVDAQETNLTNEQVDALFEQLRSPQGHRRDEQLAPEDRG